ncbi:secreted/periplasmic Zn-dependent insulinase-like peptidase [Encephalitozoon intestinalis ATCC 50506]|uniref:Secreted/periplasmic Zn-dependent insulinase-like peptidase n=1 Tax=Encephalitozoon intestinalis (strain ATCC 50506) TaxID=876142 RepID=E0S7J6_ENCIT|nr:secreted/periplasmic Zn-dependent insulinase-like peptidase [Encephalitozoon intestinalis ATCC 50506]ADM11675.2 secreted/periplasmic Zn-dependent insulinase-like peptidase [Encephalitozoon intestinalis ATCC 50506]UTX45412.1 secreted/periplasmic Zn-dependent insulinase-like peptidase [Encephalitozoon intestinalis]
MVRLSALMNCLKVAKKIHKSLTDSMEYEYVEMPNGMRGLIMSDPSLDKCSCAVSVKVGSFDNPVSTQGLAHFLEHMLFMGTEKYPDEEDFGKFLSKNNGEYNASTYGEVTVYYFDIAPEAFEEGVDRLADFFKTPLLKKNSVEREVSAVNSEFCNGLNVDDWRIWRMISRCCKKELPISMFSTGNYDTLRKEGIWEEMAEFWKQKYSCDKMCTVICGNKGLEELKEMLKMFEGVPKGTEEKKSSGNIELEADKEWTVFDSEYTNRWIRVEPIADTRSIVVTMTVESGYKIFKNNPYEYVMNMFLRDDTKGFACRVKDKGLVLQVEYEMCHYTDYSLIIITMHLSSEGNKRPERVLLELVRYLKDIPISSDEYEEIQKRSRYVFKYEESDEPMYQAQKISRNMQFFPVENVLDNEHCFEKFDKNEIKGIVEKMMNFPKWLVFHVAKGTGMFDMREEIYGVRYNVGDQIFELDLPKKEEKVFPNVLPQKSSKGKKEEVKKIVQKMTDFSKWLELQGQKDLKGEFKTEEVYSPKYNEKDKVVSEDSLEKAVEWKEGEMIKIEAPSEIISKEVSGGKINYLFNDTYKVPKVFIGCLLRMDQINENMINLIFLLRNAKSQFFRRHDGYLHGTGMNIDVRVEHYGVEIRIECFNHMSVEISRQFFDILFEEPNQSRRNLVKERIWNEFETKRNESPHKRCNEGLKCMRIPGHLMAEELMEKLSSVDTEFKMSRKFFLEMFVIGNIEYQDAEKIFENILSKQEEVYDYVKKDLLDGKYRCDVKTSDKVNNACSLNYYCGKCRNHKDAAIAHFVQQSCKAMFFDDLRTKEELGYVVGSGVLNLDDEQYIKFIVQSEKDVDFLEKRIRKFVKDLDEYFREMSEDQFEEFRNGVISFFRERKKNFEIYSTDIWNKYLRGIIDLSYEEKVVEAVNEIAKEDLSIDEILGPVYVSRVFAH